MAYGQDFCKKKHRRQDFFCEKNAPQAKLKIENVRKAFFDLTESEWVLNCSLDVVCKSLFTNDRSESSFFN